GHHHEMMNVWQISDEVDSLNKKMEKRFTSLALQSQTYFFYRTVNFIKKPIREPVNIRKFYAGLSLPQFNSAIENAMNIARTSSGFIDSANDGNSQDEYHQMDFSIGWHEKINVCFACIVLFFVGAPLGAIIRKGGLGLPVVIAVFFFLAYFIFTEAFKALTIEGVLNPWIGMWLPLYIFLPVGIFLTYKAATDSALFDMDSYLMPIKKLFSRNKN
ncbi:MAG: LptF/LptG family permease, partial [Bacteroidia bacterium]|nr:LptF/LptG family permease [Bacteroidia bacterium]